MNVPTMKITTINTVTCFQCFEKIVDDGDIVFGLNNDYRNVHTAQDSCIFVMFEINVRWCQGKFTANRGLEGAGETATPGRV